MPIKVVLRYPGDERSMTTDLSVAQACVPRYTSYPTAPHFSPRVGPRTYTEWLIDLPRSATLSLYLHVPYCRQLCHYCGCTTKATRRAEPVERYAQRLAEEIGLVGALAGRHTVQHLHWGGGTPSILGESSLENLTERLRATFDLSAIREHAIELDPRKVTRSLARALARIGVNRASLGVQDVSPHVQHAIGRIQPVDVVERGAALLREAGIVSLNVDLMYGLPTQALDDVRRSAAFAVSLEPQRISLFGYAHVPWFKRHQAMIDADALPGPEERLSQARIAARVFESAGYVPVGLDHFARPEDELAIAARSGRLRRNFQGYTVDSADALIGLGASAIGHLPQGYVQNASDAAGYARAVSAGRLATVRGLALSDADRLRARVIERLMCDLAVDLDAVVTGFGSADSLETELHALQPLADRGLIKLDGRRVEVMPSGRPYLRVVAAAFDAYLPKQTARHSAAV